MTYGSVTWTLIIKDVTIPEALKMWLAKNKENIMDGNKNIQRSVWFSVRFVREKTFRNNLKSNRGHVIGHTLGHNKDLYSIIIEGMIERKRGKGQECLI